MPAIVAMIFERLSSCLCSGVLSSSISSVAATAIRPVGGHPVARLHEHDVAGRQLLGVDLDLDGLAVAAHPGHCLEHPGQRPHALLGLGLLAQPDHRVEHGQPGQHQRGAPLAGHQLVDHRRGQQHELHEIAVLAQERRAADSFFAPVSRFGPCSPMRSAACAAVSPRSTLTPNDSAACGTVLAYHRSAAAGTLF